MLKHLCHDVRSHVCIDITSHLPGSLEHIFIMWMTLFLPLLQKTPDDSSSQCVRRLEAYKVIQPCYSLPISSDYWKYHCAIIVWHHCAYFLIHLHFLLPHSTLGNVLVKYKPKQLENECVIVICHAIQHLWWKTSQDFNRL